MQFSPAVEQWRPLVERYFGSLTDPMLAIMTKESGGDPNAHNPGVNGSEDSWGLFQVNRLAWGHTPAELTDPETNVALARQIFDAQGFGAWFNSASALGLLGSNPVVAGTAPAGSPAPGSPSNSTPDWIPAAAFVFGAFVLWELLS